MMYLPFKGVAMILHTPFDIIQMFGKHFNQFKFEI